MHYGQSRRSPRTVANGTRGPHRGQGRREMKRGVNSLRQALRPPTSPIHTHSRVSCHCPIAGTLSRVTQTTRGKTSPPFSPIWPDGSQQRKRCARRWSFRGRTLEKGISATADNVRKAAANLGTSRAEPRKRLMALTILRHHRHSVSWSRSIRASVGAVDGENSLRQRVNWFQRRAFAGSYSPLQNAEILPSMSLTSSAKWSFR